jgi:phosphoribosylaminoimidazole synthetase
MIGGFGGEFDLAEAGYTDPIMVSGTDGVGTKLMLAHKVGSAFANNAVGVDCVAMCVNDIVTMNAEPLWFLDYMATGALQAEAAAAVVTGVADGCKQAKCGLIGGETAEMPAMYSAGTYDVAGFTVGAMERGSALPKFDDMQPGDVLM